MTDWLKVVLEHITTTEAAEFVAAASINVAATITPQHLSWSRNALLVGGMRPHFYCMPVLKREAHRLSLMRAATSASPKYFLGTDSAPHERNAKESACGCAGCYSAPTAIELYAAYWLVRGKQEFPALLALYAGHISAMAAALHLLDTRIVESTAWALLALACLGIAWAQRDRLLGQSSLLLFGATAAKVMLYDLSGAPPVARIISLVVLGVAFYVGGLLYQRIDRAAAQS